MRWVKKIIRAILNLLPVLSILFIVNGNSSAKSYPVNSFPLSSNSYQFRKILDSSSGQPVYTFFEKHLSPSIYTDTVNSSFPSGFQYPETWQISGDYISSSDSCSIPNFFQDSSSYYSSGWKSSYYSRSDVYGYSFYSPSSIDFSSLDITDSFNTPFDITRPLGSQLSGSLLKKLCSINGQPYDSDPYSRPPITQGIPAWDFSSIVNIPLVNNRLKYASDEPYTYAYNTININGRNQSSDGIYYQNDGIKFSDIFKVSVPSFSMLNFSFDDFNNVTTWLSPEDTSDSSTSERVYNFTLKGSISFESSYTLNNSSTGIFLSVDNYYNPYFVTPSSTSGSLFINGHTVYPLSSRHSESICSVTEFHSDQGDDSNQIDFSCDYNPITANAFSNEINFRFLNWSINFNGSGTGSWDFSPFLSTSGDFTFKDFYIITNGDLTPSGWSGSPIGSGGNTSSTPGSNIGTGSTVDYTYSLSHLFSFDFLNPFAGLFNLFSDNSSCASIPTLSGMLNAQESQVCPWFDSTTRNIVTPVLGLSSMMLLVGFVVRWLGSSSGNMFEDQTSHKWGNTQIKQRGVK